MAKFDDALRGYAHDVLKRDGFRCRYCGLDGKALFSNWLALSLDHLLPRGHPLRDDARFTVAACTFCNAADNRYFDLAASRGLAFEGLSPEELVARRSEYVLRTRAKYRQFWEANVNAANAQT